MYFAWISEITAFISAYSINLFAFTSINKAESVYCAVRAGSSIPAYTVSPLFVLFYWPYNPLCLYFHSPVAGFSLLVFERFLDHTQRCATVSRTPLDE
jgi:hypothetical protein